MLQNVVTSKNFAAFKFLAICEPHNPHYFITDYVRILCGNFAFGIDRGGVLSPTARPCIAESPAISWLNLLRNPDPPFEKQNRKNSETKYHDGNEGPRWQARPHDERNTNDHGQDCVLRRPKSELTKDGPPQARKQEVQCPGDAFW